MLFKFNNDSETPTTPLVESKFSPKLSPKLDPKLNPEAVIKSAVVTSNTSEFLFHFTNESIRDTPTEMPTTTTVAVLENKNFNENNIIKDKVDKADVKINLTSEKHIENNFEDNNSNNKIFETADDQNLLGFDTFFVNYFKNNLSLNNLEEHEEDQIQNLIKEQTIKLSKIKFKPEMKHLVKISTRLSNILLNFIQIYDFQLITSLFSNIDRYLINLYLNLLQVWNDYYCDLDAKFYKVNFFEISFFKMLELSYNSNDYSELIEAKINYLSKFKDNNSLIIPIYVNNIENPDTKDLFIAKLSIEDKILTLYDAKDILHLNPDYGNINYKLTLY